MQQLFGQTNPAAAAMLSATNLLTPPPGFGVSGQTGLTGLPSMQAGMAGPTNASAQTSMTGQTNLMPSYPPGFGPAPALSSSQDINATPLTTLANQTCSTSHAGQTLSGATAPDIATGTVSKAAVSTPQVGHSSVSNLSDISSTGLSMTEESRRSQKGTHLNSISTVTSDSDDVFQETQGGADMELTTSLGESKKFEDALPSGSQGSQESVSSSALDIELGNLASAEDPSHVTKSIAKETTTYPDLSLDHKPVTGSYSVSTSKSSVGSDVTSSPDRRDNTLQRSNQVINTSTDKTIRLLKRYVVITVPATVLFVISINSAAIL